MARMTRGINPKVELLPTLTGGPGNAVYKRGGMEFAIAKLPEVSDYLLGQAMKAYYRAWTRLGAVRAANTNFGDITRWVILTLQKGRIDWHLVLTDTKAGHKGAMSIEFGRGDYTLTSKTGQEFRIKGMEGKGILHFGVGQPLGSLQGTGGGEIK